MKEQTRMLRMVNKYDNKRNPVSQPPGRVHVWACVTIHLGGTKSTKKERAFTIVIEQVIILSYQIPKIQNLILILILTSIHLYSHLGVLINYVWKEIDESHQLDVVLTTIVVYPWEHPLQCEPTQTSLHVCKWWACTAINDENRDSVIRAVSHLGCLWSTTFFAFEHRY